MLEEKFGEGQVDSYNYDLVRLAYWPNTMRDEPEPAPVTIAARP